MTSLEIKTILKEHCKWLEDNKRGKYADLRWADLSRANLKWADIINSLLSLSQLKL